MVLFAQGFIIIFMWAMWWEMRNRFDAIEDRALRIHTKLEEISEKQHSESQYLKQIWRLRLREKYKSDNKTEDEIFETLQFLEHVNDGGEADQFDKEAFRELSELNIKKEAE